LTKIIYLEVKTSKREIGNGKNAMQTPEKEKGPREARL